MELHQCQNYLHLLGLRVDGKLPGINQDCSASGWSRPPQFAQALFCSNTAQRINDRRVISSQRVILCELHICCHSNKRHSEGTPTNDATPPAAAPHTNLLGRTDSPLQAAVLLAHHWIQGHARPAVRDLPENARSDTCTAHRKYLACARCSHAISAKYTRVRRPGPPAG